MTLDSSKKTLIENYEQKLENLREELELRMKVEIHEIEERKNQHINDLMRNHQEAFKEMKEYYNDITKENLELIKMHKEKLVDIRAQIEANQKTVDHLKLKMEELKVPLANCLQDRDNLKKSLATFDKDVMALTNAKARLEVLKQKVKEIKDQRKELEEKFLKVEREKKDMYRKFEVAISQLRSRADYKN
jgi:chromosome segregation ATPase